MSRAAINRKVSMYQIISIAMVAALALVIILFLAQGGGSRKPISEVSPKAEALFSNDKSQKSSERLLKKYYGLNPEEYDGVVLYFPITNMDAEEMLIIRLADPAQAEEVVNAIRERNLSQCNVYEGYAPEQFALCENAVIDVQGNYILYVVHGDADRIDAAFKEAL